MVLPIPGWDGKSDNDKYKAQTHPDPGQPIPCRRGQGEGKGLALVRTRAREEDVPLVLSQTQANDHLRIGIARVEMHPKCLFPVAGHLIPIQLIALHKGLAQRSLAPAARRGAHGVAPQALGHAGVVNGVGVEIVEAKEALKAGANGVQRTW